MKHRTPRDKHYFGEESRMRFVADEQDYEERRAKMQIPAETLAKAAIMWHQDFTDNERAAVRIGMFPYHAMMQAEKEGHDGRELSVALMDEAKKHGGMIA